jgi:hypothetical protein
VFSSIGVAFGIPGQSNYAFGNGVMESVCQQRAKEGHHALAIEWGTIDNLGFVARNSIILESLIRMLPQIRIDNVLQFTDDLLSSSINGTCVQYYALPYKKTKDTKAEPLTSDRLLSKISRVININLDTCNAGDSLETLGVDSLQAVEIQNILLHQTQEVFPLKKLSSTTIGDLRDFIKLKLDNKNKKLPPNKTQETANA